MDGNIMNVITITGEKGKGLEEIKTKRPKIFSTYFSGLERRKIEI